ncbi:MAG: class I SAM-dependent methyltransferase [Bacteroidales bacterium]|nr:class I SAM-dependent methyltransferase [Bacteroidales bacterium]MBN2821381.1 class I SAM-dependent methyltransferase [Bacteroidales bacterium]
MIETWNERYQVEEYVYGREPNQFFKSELLHLKPGNILFPADGEGRNSVYSATLGWKAFAFDSSEVAKEKALKLANKFKVCIDYQLASYNDAQYEPDFFDCIALLFAHMPSRLRAKQHQKLLSYLKPGGTLILEAYSKEQINYNTGGPKNIDLLYSKNELEEDFKELSTYDISISTICLDEGIMHNGKSSVIRFVGTK